MYSFTKEEDFIAPIICVNNRGYFYVKVSLSCVKNFLSVELHINNV